MAPIPRRRAAHGQASLEYAGLLALVAALLVAAGAGAAASGVGAAVAQALRTGICVVAGDVCRASDAAAAGLAPCTLHEARRGGGGAVTLVSVRLGRRGEWSVARRSDGSVLVTRTRDRSAGVTGGIGVTASPLGVRLGAQASYALGVADGEAWELPDAAAAARLLAADAGERPPPTWRFGDLGAQLAADAGASAGGVPLTAFEASARAAAGARIGRGVTTLYVRARLDGPAVRAILPGGRAALVPGTGDVLVELTRDGAGPREIGFRTVRPGAQAGRVVEVAGRLDLRDPANRAAAAPLLDHPLPWPPSVAAALRAVVRRTAQAGIVERALYAVRDDSRELHASARFGVEVGARIERTRVDRRLLAASAWTGGSGARERVDCLGS